MVSGVYEGSVDPINIPLETRVCSGFTLKAVYFSETLTGNLLCALPALGLQRLYI